MKNPANLGILFKIINLKKDFQEITELLTISSKEIVIDMIIQTILSLGSFSKILFVYITGRRYNFSIIFYLDGSMIIFFIYFITVFYYNSRKQDIDPIYYFIEAANPDDRYSIFSLISVIGIGNH